MLNLKSADNSPNTIVGYFQLRQMMSMSDEIAAVSVGSVVSSSSSDTILVLPSSDTILVLPVPILTKI